MDSYVSDLWNLISAHVIINGRITLMKEQCHISPEDSGLFVKSIGKPKGQIADWRSRSPREGSTLSVHVVEFHDSYEVHTDMYDPMISPIKHLIYDFSPDIGKNILTAGAAYFAVRKLMSLNRK